jgi:hypothetical protein
MEELDLGGDITYSERPIKILDTTERMTHVVCFRLSLVSGAATDYLLIFELFVETIVIIGI